MSEQPTPAQVLAAELSIFMFGDHTETEVDFRAEGFSHKDIAKRLYAEARHFERIHRDLAHKNKGKKK